MPTNEIKKYLAENGRKGGQISRRKLTKKQAREMVKARESKREEITTANGLLYRHGQFINLPEADSIAIARGYQCAEQLVRALEAAGKKTVATKPRHSPSAKISGEKPRQ